MNDTCVCGHQRRDHSGPRGECAGCTGVHSFESVSGAVPMPMSVADFPAMTTLNDLWADYDAAHLGHDAARRAIEEAIRAEAGVLDAAWAQAEAALPEGWELMLGHTLDCSHCQGYWATARWAGEIDGIRRLKMKSSEDGRPRGQHHDATPTAALDALTEKL